MAGVPGTASAIFGMVKDVGANVIMISQATSEHSVCFAVPEKEVAAVAKALQTRFRQALDVGCLSQVVVVPNCSILAAVGQKMASTPGVSATLFNALAKANVNVRAIAQGCSEYNVTGALKREDSIRALKAVHSRFYLSKTTIAMGIIGPGLIGGTLLDQFRDQAATLKEEFNIDLQVMGIIGSRKMILSNLGTDLSKWREIQKEKAEATDMEKFVQHVHGNHFIPNTVLVDCTKDTDVANHYYNWICKGIHVITPNKKANSGPLDRKFSEVVTEAKQAGFTEPDPRDDRSGMDVARKVIILARESGLRLELADISVQSLVPEPLRESASTGEFLTLLPKFDGEMTKTQQEAESTGEALRYVGVVDAINSEGRVELKTYKKEHPFAQLSGSDNIIAFTTNRYKEQPLIVRGPGAGAQVTAGGIFSDILLVGSYLGAPS